MNCATLSLGSMLKVLTIEAGRAQYWSMLEITRAIQTVRNHNYASKSQNSQGQNGSIS